jgi:hypothetical protein
MSQIIGKVWDNTAEFVTNTTFITNTKWSKEGSYVTIPICFKTNLEYGLVKQGIYAEIRNQVDSEVSHTQRVFEVELENHIFSTFSLAHYGAVKIPLRTINIFEDNANTSIYCTVKNRYFNA